MTEEERNLLLQDLCGRLPYGVKANVSVWDEEKQEEVNILSRVYSIDTDGYVRFESNDYGVNGIEHCSLFLRPMSSMTEEEEDELCKLCTLSDCNVNADWEFCGIEIIGSHPRYGTYFSTDYSAIEWLNKNMFDYRGLIPKGLALKATEGMYSN